MVVANMSVMKAAIAQCPIVTETETQPRQQSVVAVPPQSVFVTANAKTTEYIAKSIVIISGAAMMFCLINYGRIFKNYLQW